MKHFKFMTVAVVVAMLFALAGCAGEAPESSGDTKTLKIGTIGPYEGDLSVYGTAVRNGADLAIKDYNATHGTNYELVAYDTKGENIQAVNSYNKLVEEDGVIAIVGGTISSESIAIASASQSNQTVIISPSATANDFTAVGPNIFRGCYTDAHQAKVIAEFAYDELGARTAAILYNTGGDYQKGLMENFVKGFEAKGGKMVAVEGYADGDVDFNTQLTKIKAQNPDVLFSPNYYEEDALISAQVKALGIETTIVGGDGWDGILTSVSDPSTVEGVVFVNHYSPEDEAVQELASKYKAAYGSDLNAFAVTSYDSTTCLLQAIDNAGSTDSAAIIESLHNIKFDGVLGHMEFDENGEPIRDLGYITIKDGKYVTYRK